MTRGQDSELATWPLRKDGSDRIIGESKMSILRFWPQINSP